ncbi:RNA polymerase-binding protein RbpA [Actinomycetaceae bacterium TAE3-ERU4]|nr:RNA polymerase-binding protein RbpA [Actinomycetaceae bacterium TAE3-ERU4]
MSVNSPGPIRGSRVGSTAARASSDVVDAPRITIAYFCISGHVTKPVFSKTVEGDIPLQWTCGECGLPAGLDPENPPEPPVNVPFKTHLDYVRERRSEEDGQALLEEALGKLRNRFHSDSSSTETHYRK